MVVLILAQSAATSRAYAMKYGDSFDENVDLVGLGLANAAAGISGTFVVNGSPTKTEMVDSAGGRSQIAQLTTGAVVVVVLLFLTGPLSYMPNAVLSAVVFLIGIRLIDIKGMRGHRPRSGRASSRSPLVTAAVVVVVGVEQGIILAIVLSILEHISHSYKPYDRLLTLAPTGALVSSPARQPAPGGARPRHLPLRGEPLLRERDPVHRGGPEHRRGRRSAARAGSCLDASADRRRRLLGLGRPWARSTRSWSGRA